LALPERAGTLVRLAPGLRVPPCLPIHVGYTVALLRAPSRSVPAVLFRARPVPLKHGSRGFRMGSVVKKRRKRMAKKKHRKLLRKTRVQRRRLGK
jgi:hypothetical protein